MPETAKKAESQNDGTENAAPASDKLIESFDRTSDHREWGDIHYYTFEDGTSAKVWTVDKTHVSVQLRDAKGRGYSNTTSENVTIHAANTMLESAGQKAKDEVAKAAAAN